MAQKVQVLLVDDLDGTEAHETVSFALDGKSYEIDLRDDNAKALRAVLDVYTNKGRRTGGRQVKRPAAAAPTVSSSTIREWAKANGRTVNGRGRVPAEIREAYAKANA